jgi:hypothetical protein
LLREAADDDEAEGGGGVREGGWGAGVVTSGRLGVGVAAPPAVGEVEAGTGEDPARPTVLAFFPFFDPPAADVDAATGSGAEAFAWLGGERPFSAAESSWEPAGVGGAVVPFVGFFLFFFELAFTPVDASSAGEGEGDKSSGPPKPPGIDADLDKAVAEGLDAVAAGASEVSPATAPVGFLVAFFFFAFFEVPAAPPSCCFSPDEDEVVEEGLENWVYPSPTAPARARTVAAPSGDTIDCALPMVLLVYSGFNFGRGVGNGIGSAVLRSVSPAI